MKKILALLIAAVMCFGILAACGGEEEPPAPPTSDPGPGTNDGDGSAGEGDAEPEWVYRQQLAEQYGLPWSSEMESWEPITFTYFDRNPGEPPRDDNPHIKIVEEITNVKIEWQMNSGDLETVMGNQLSTKSVADITFYGGQAGVAIESKLFIPLEDLIEQHAPRLRAHFDPWWELMKYKDGHIYTAEIWGTPVGRQVTTWANGSAFWIQKAVLEHFGKPPADIDEYFEYLREYADIYPKLDDDIDTIPFLIRNVNDGNGRFSLDNGGYFLGGNANWGGAVNTDGDHYEAAISPDVTARWTSDFQYKWWKKLNEEFHLGTFTEETFTLDNDRYNSRVASGAVLGFHDQEWNLGGATGALEAEGKYNRTWLPLALTYDGIEPNYMDGRAFTGSNGINISTSNPDPVRTIQFMDWMIDESVQRFLHWGIEGENYFYNDEGLIERYPEQRELQMDTRWNTDNLGRFLRNAFPKMQGSYPSDGNATDTDQSELEYFAGLSGYDRDLFEKLGIYSMTGFWGDPKPRPPYYPYWSLTSNLTPGSPEQLASQAISDANLEIAKMIVAPAEDFDDLFAAYVASIEAIDVTPLEEHIRAGAQARLDAFGG